MLSFRLTDDFIEFYKNQEPPFGFIDAGNNSLGHITFLRTYSRIKGDGTKEHWYEVCRRVIEGMYSIQKDWATKNRLPWNSNKAQTSAREAYDRMFKMKWTPPGRGIHQMGAGSVLGGNSASLQNCFGGDTEFITKDGVKTFVDSVGNTELVWDGKKWVDATIQSFGFQRLQRITFAPFSNGRSNHRVVETATYDHRWILRGGNETVELQEGDIVPASAISFNSSDENGFRHGMVYGDGSINYIYANGDYGHMMRLCGDKQKHKDLFDKYSYQPNCNGDPVIYHRSSTNMKVLPIDPTPEYANGFIDGLIVTDGSASGDAFEISTQNKELVDWLVSYAALGGYIVIGNSVDSSSETNYGMRKSPLRKIRIRKAEERYWKVISIEKLDELEEVFCAVVPSTGRFSLASGILTGNCANVSTGDMNRYDPGYVFQWGMEALMNGVGLGFDTLGEHLNIVIEVPHLEAETFIIPDTREGWADSVRVLINSYLRKKHPVIFDYSLIRPAGTPLKTFGGVASGADPLMHLHEQLRNMFNSRQGEIFDARAIVDIFNMIAGCVVAGNVRRSAELAMGEYGDDTFLNLKNPEAFPERNSYDPKNPGWAWASNNSINVPVGADYSQYVDRIVSNGEPGLIWLDVAKTRGRMMDPPDTKDIRVAGFNPCSEQPLESFEMCTLTTVHLQNADSKEDFLRTLKFAFLYAKTVTLLPTNWIETNSVMQRNRRIGLSLTGITDVLDSSGMPLIIDYMESGYEEIRKWDEIYSEWLCVRESNRVTTIKPEGTVSILSGASPGIHWGPGGKFYMRAIRFADTDPMLRLFKSAGYKVEPDLVSQNTQVVYFPVKSNAHRSEKEVSIFEKIGLAAKAQEHWSDNGVSVTVSFDKNTERDYLVPALRLHEGRLKAVSFLPMGNDIYPQAPYTSISEDEYGQYVGQLKKIDWSPIYNGLDNLEAVGEKYCSSDTCSII